MQDQDLLVSRKKRRSTNRTQTRGIAGASLEVSCRMFRRGLHACFIANVGHQLLSDTQSSIEHALSSRGVCIVHFAALLGAVRSLFRMNSWLMCTNSAWLRSPKPVLWVAAFLRSFRRSGLRSRNSDRHPATPSCGQLLLLSLEYPCSMADLPCVHYPAWHLELSIRRIGHAGHTHSFPFFPRSQVCTKHGSMAAWFLHTCPFEIQTPE